MKPNQQKATPYQTATDQQSNSLLMSKAKRARLEADQETLEHCFEKIKERLPNSSLPEADQLHIISALNARLARVPLMLSSQDRLAGQLKRLPQNTPSFQYAKNASVHKTTPVIDYAIRLLLCWKSWRSTAYAKKQVRHASL